LAPEICSVASFINSKTNRELTVCGMSLFVPAKWFVPLCLTQNRGLFSQMKSLQSEIEQRGACIFELVDKHPESLFSKAGFYQRMMALSMRDERFKVQMFRFVDVLPSLRKSGEIIQHLEEYFAGMRDGFAARCLDLLECLARETRDWTDPLGKNSELFPVVNLSVKISALYSQMNPADPTDAIAHLAPKLRPILRRACELGAFINFDMESYAHKNTTLELFKTIFTEEEFKDWPHAGIVIQAYLRDSEVDLRDLIEWGRARGTRFAVRLVKGAYWDYETIKSRQNGWDCPV